MSAAGTARCEPAVFVALLGLLLSVLVARRAEAYPQWQLATGAARCNQCHLAPAGGGLLTDYGRRAIGEELSTVAFDEPYAYAARLPSAFALGAKLRGAALLHEAQDPDGTKRAAFPMQADLLARVALGEALSISVTAGLRGRVRPGGSLVPDQNYQPISTSRLVSREHYLTWQPGRQGAYARAGRFFAPFGLRLAEHVLYVRRELGFNLLEESYNLSGGYLSDDWEAHLTLFAPDVLRRIGASEAGAAAYGERRVLDGRAAVALQGRFGAGEGARRLTAGAVGKLFLPGWTGTLLLAEANLTRVFVGSGGRMQLVGAGGVAFFPPLRGTLLTLLVERQQTDLAVFDASWNAVTALLGWFPYPHLELQLMARAQFPAGTPATKTLFAQVHLFF